MPNYSQLKRPAGRGACQGCHKELPLYLFSQQGGLVARTGRATEGSFAKEERELRKPVEWSKNSYCSYSCFAGGSPTPKALVWKVLRKGSPKPYEVSRHTSQVAAQKALSFFAARSVSEFYIEGPGGKPGNPGS